MSDTTTKTTDTNAIEAVAEKHEAMNETLKLLAAELGLSPRDLELGASATERQAEAEKAALFGATEAAAEKADDGRSTADVAAELMEQNAANLARIAREAGVSKRQLPLEAGTSKLEAQKADLFTSGSGDDAEKGIPPLDGDADGRERWGEFLHPNTSPEVSDEYGEVYRDPERDADPAAGDRSD